MVRSILRYFAIMFCALLVGMHTGDVGGQNIDPLISFLETYYSLPAYEAAPQSIEEVYALISGLSPYATSEALDQMVADRINDMVSTSAYSLDCVFSLSNIIVERDAHTESRVQYTYHADLTATFRDNTLKTRSVKGKIQLTPDATHALVCGFYPDIDYADHLIELFSI